MLVSLTKTAKKGLELKQNLIEEVRTFLFFSFFRSCIWFIKVGIGLYVMEIRCLKEEERKRVLVQPLFLQGQH